MGDDYLDALFSRWDQEDRFHREYGLGAVILEAVEMSRRGDVTDGLRAMIRDTRRKLKPRVTKKASPAKLRRRAITAAGRRANVRRLGARA